MYASLALCWLILFISYCAFGRLVAWKHLESIAAKAQASQKRNWAFWVCFLAWRVPLVLVLTACSIVVFMLGHEGADRYLDGGALGLFVMSPLFLIVLVLLPAQLYALNKRNWEEPQTTHLRNIAARIGLLALATALYIAGHLISANH
jgi:hypothetical protein